MNKTIERLEKEILNLTKKLEAYYYLLLHRNELDFILKGTYITEDEINAILEGNY